MKKPNTTTGFIRKGLGLLKNEYPDRYIEAAGLIQTVPGIYLAGNDLFSIQSQNNSIVVSKSKVPGNPRIRAEFDHKDIVALVDGRKTLPALLAAEKLVVFADAEALLNLSEVVRLIITSALWSSALQRHFDDYREWVSFRNGN